jgi:APA family basic amino acid/polyamine antiporter
MIEQAKVQGGRRVSGHWVKVRPGGAGRRIVDEARKTRARAIVMPLPERRAQAGGSLFGKTLETVLAERPCRVIIESAPVSSAQWTNVAQAPAPIAPGR